MPMFAITAPVTANPTPYISLSQSYSFGWCGDCFGILLLFYGVTSSCEIRAIPIVANMNTKTSCLVIDSPMVKNAIIDIRNGFSRIRITLLAAIIFIAENSSRCEIVSEITLMRMSGLC